MMSFTQTATKDFVKSHSCVFSTWWLHLLHYCLSSHCGHEWECIPVKCCSCSWHCFVYGFPNHSGYAGFSISGILTSSALAGDQEEFLAFRISRNQFCLITAPTQTRLLFSRTDEVWWLVPSPRQILSTVRFPSPRELSGDVKPWLAECGPGLLVCFEVS